VTWCSSIASSSALCVFGTGAVDLVGEQHVSEHRAGMEDEGLARALVDADADQVRRHEVGSELRARELQPERDRDRVRERRLADAGDVLDQEVAAGEEAGDAVLDLGPLADDDRANLVDEFGQLGGKRSAHRPDITRKNRRSKTDDHGVLHTSRLPQPRHGLGHPECPARLDAIDDLLIASGLQGALACREAPLVDSTDLGNAHSSGYVAELRDVLERVAADGRMRALDP
jgi:hypothetical protein